MSNIVTITDIDSSELSLFTRLTEAQLRNRLEPSKGIFIAESPKVIRIALQQGYTPLALLCEERHIAGDAQDIVNRCGNIPIYTGSRDLLHQLTGYEVTRGVLCAMRRPQPKKIDDICAHSHRIAVMDSVVNSTNTGAIFRAAAALGIDGIVLTETCSDPLNRRAVRVSMGTILQLPWCYGGTMLTTINNHLRGYGFKSVALALTDDSVSIDDPILASHDKLAIIMGTEGDGLSHEAIASCDYVARIPMHRDVDSLNVAAAAAIAFWQLQFRDLKAEV